MKARFWTVYEGSPVKLALADGERLDHVRSERHDEGRETQWTTWERAGAAITLDRYIAGSDCDGPYSRSFEAECPIKDLHAWEPSSELANDHPEVIGLPHWQDMREERRDYRAESMGY